MATTMLTASKDLRGGANQAWSSSPVNNAGCREMDLYVCTTSSFFAFTPLAVNHSSPVGTEGHKADGLSHTSQQDSTYFLARLIEWTFQHF